jgi:PAS domain S-box-containing protein
MVERERKTVLLVEDEAVIAMATAATIGTWGYEVLVARSGEKAVHIVETGERIDLILMDIDLGPGMSGSEAAARILASASVPIVFLTSHSERAMVEKVRGLTRYGYVIKNSGDFVLRSSMEMAFELYEAHSSIKSKMEALQDSEERFRKLFEQSIDAIFLVELSSGRYLDANKASEKLTGRSVEELKESKTYEISPRGAGERLETMSRARGPLELGEVEYVQPDGSTRTAMLNSILLGDGRAFGIAHDITERRRAEEAVQKSEAQFRSLFENAPAGVFYSTVDGRIIQVNEEYARIMGFRSAEDARETINRSSAGEVLYEKAGEREGLIAGALRSPGSWIKTEWQYRRKEGTRITADLAFRALPETPDVLEGFVTDISERKLAEAALKESKHFLERILSSTPNLVYIYDVIKKKNEYSNRMVLDFLGYSSEQIKEFGPALFDNILHPDDAGLVENHQARFFQAEEEDVLDVEYRMRHSDGTWHVLKSRDVLFGVLQILGSSEDVTERKTAEQALRESEERFRLLVRDMQVGVVLQDPKAEIVLANPKALELLGLSEDQLLGKTSYDPDWNVVHEDGAPFPGETHPVSRAIATRRPVRGVVMGVFNPRRGDRVWLSVDAEPQLNADGSPRQIVCSFTDISERKRAEDEVKSLLAEKELILKEVHHRIKNNLGTVKSLLALQAGMLPDAAAVAAFHDTEFRVQSMMILYERLYQSSNFRDICMRDYLPALIDQIVDNFPNRAGVRVEKDIGEFVLDAKRLLPFGIIINELLTNCMKYAFPDRNDGVIYVSARLSDNRVTAIVQDNGLRIPEESEIEKPSGLGLMLVRELTLQLEGAIRVERENGTRVVLEFPI